MLLNNKEFILLNVKHQVSDVSRLFLKVPLKTPFDLTQRNKTNNRSKKQHSFIVLRRMGLFLRLLGGFLFALLSITSLQLISTTATAASIRVQTHNTIEGSAPALGLYGSSTPATSIKELLSFIIDDEGTEKTITPDTPSSDIVIDGTKTIATQVKTVLAPNVPNGELALNTLAESVIKVLDIDGDANPANRLNEIKGRINVQWLDKDDTPLTAADLQANPDICRSPYHLKIAVTGAQAQTAYGAPNVSPKLSATNIYSIKIKNMVPRFCYAQPALTPHYTTTNPKGDVVPPISVWNPKNGFTVQSTTDATKNFPGTGFPDAWFYLIAGGVDDIGNTGDWKAVPVGREGINVTVERAGKDRLKVRFVDAKLDVNGNFVPTEFKIVNTMDASKSFDYKFRVHTWITFDAINLRQSQADIYCNNKGQPVLGKPSWSTYRIRGTEVYGITDSPPYTESQYIPHLKLRAVASDGKKQGFYVFHEWGDRLFQSRTLAQRQIEMGFANTPIEMSFQEISFPGMMHYRSYMISTQVSFWTATSSHWKDGVPYDRDDNLQGRNRCGPGACPAFERPYRSGFDVANHALFRGCVNN